MGVDRSSPLLEETHPLTPAVRAPQIAPAGAVVAAVVRSVVAGYAAPDAGPPVDLDYGWVVGASLVGSLSIIIVH